MPSALVRLIIRAYVWERLWGRGTPWAALGLFCISGWRMWQQNTHFAQQSEEKKTTRAGRAYPQHTDLRVNFPKQAWNQNGAPRHESSAKLQNQDKSASCLVQGDGVRRENYGVVLENSRDFLVGLSQRLGYGLKWCLRSYQGLSKLSGMGKCSGESQELSKAWYK